MSNTGDLIVVEARKHLSKQYVWATAGPNTFDCSGLVHFVVKQVTGQTISRSSYDQAGLGTPVSKANLRPGDILCYDTMGDGRCGHVGIYESSTSLINALNEDKGVVRSNPFSSYFNPIFLGARRLFAYSDGTGSTPAPTPKFGTGSSVKATEGVNLRSSASISSGVVATLPAGATGTVQAGPTTANGYTWWKLQTNLGTGWAAEDWLAKTTAPPPPTQTGKFKRGDDVRTNDSDVNFRSSPSTSGAVIGALANGQRGTVVDGPQTNGGYTWWKLQTSLGLGWAVENWLILDQGVPPKPKFNVDDPVKATEDINFRSTPSTSASIIGNLKSGATGTVVGGPSAANGYNWYNLRTALGTGWAADEWLIKSGSTTPPPVPDVEVWTHKVTYGPLNLRISHTTSSSVVGVLANNVRLQILSGPLSGEGYTWYQVKAEGVGTGWCVNGFDPI